MNTTRKKDISCLGYANMSEYVYDFWAPLTYFTSDSSEILLNEHTKIDHASEHEKEILCNLNQLDQEGEADFQCEAYGPKPAEAGLCNIMFVMTCY